MLSFHTAPTLPSVRDRIQIPRHVSLISSSDPTHPDSLFPEFRDLENAMSTSLGALPTQSLKWPQFFRSWWIDQRLIWLTDSRGSLPVWCLCLSLVRSSLTTKLRLSINRSCLCLLAAYLCPLQECRILEDRLREMESVLEQERSLCCELPFCHTHPCLATPCLPQLTDISETLGKLISLFSSILITTIKN